MTKKDTPVTARSMPVSRTCAARSSRRLNLGLFAPEELDQQDTADVEGLVEHGVHARIGLHLFAGNIAQPGAHTAGGIEEQRQDDDTDQRQMPFKGKHHGEHCQYLDDIGDDAHDGIADGVLCADHIVVEAAEQLANFGVGEKTQRHALQVGEERHPQVVDHAFTDAGVQSALEDIQDAA